jgi:hypothetical protein
VDLVRDRLDSGAEAAEQQPMCPRQGRAAVGQDQAQ